ncbi:MAG: hypothetical protein A2V81_04740 [Candidatus Abawacabacteria bacterium RBG_16_42_10]|uniref:DUF11 domain-containing protein n=1 Tax=Candidatus Abawacabacteria bacterium RBG_16_42_10 TaxID=1817814 RepID=A0A1F4XJT7_9BACT|nr:MAG: hypothetical protein A2V81_04740 [Candidatus Abawacabacteria bacterium RBG_16_42_10]
MWFGAGMVSVLVLVAAFQLVGGASGAGQSGTTLTTSKTADGHMTRTYDWTIEKSVSPSSLDMFRGDSADVEYTVTINKDEGTDTYSVSGEICVTNGGEVSTENLTIVDEVQYKVGSGQFDELTSSSIDMSSKPVLGPGESHCYPYTISFTPVNNASYRNVAHITITNHSGWLPGGNNCPGTDPCAFGPEPKDDFDLPSTPDVLVNDEVTVTDTNGHSWNFGSSGSQIYDKTFTCDTDDGQQNNTATIEELNTSDTASVMVQCYALQMKKTAETAFKRTHNWTIEKGVTPSSLTLAVNQILPLNYAVTVNSPGYTDSDWKVTGTITVTNPAPMNATLTGVSDVVTPAIAATVNCPSLTVPSQGNIQCTYSSSLPDGSTRTNIATATLKNTPSGTTNFSANAAVDFATASKQEIDKIVDVSDSLQGVLGTVTKGVDPLPKVFAYVRNAGPYSTCGTYAIENIATLKTRDTLKTLSASRNIPVSVPCSGCSLTIGYWKTHAGFGPQADKVTQKLPVSLGTANGAKTVTVTTASQAVQILNFGGDASNGINKLYAQLLAAKLNIKNGADGTAIASVITAADTFLATKNASDWSGLTKPQKAQVNSWMSTLDQYNNGLIGPGHCSE